VADTTPLVPGFLDRLGDRVHVTDDGTQVEVLRLRPELTGSPVFEAAVRRRMEQLGHFDHPNFAKAHQVRRLAPPDGRLVIVSEAVDGWRLSEVLEAVDHLRKPIHSHAVVFLLRQLFGAVSSLHDVGAGISHGALGTERLVLTPDFRLVVTESVLGGALRYLPSMPPDRLWRELRLAVAEGEVQLFGRLTDLRQLGVIALSLALGRQLRRDEFLPRLASVLSALPRIRSERGADPFGPALQDWLAHVLSLAGGETPWSVVEAQRELSRIVESDPGLAFEPVGLGPLLQRVAEYYEADANPDAEPVPTASRGRILTPAPAASPKPAAAPVPTAEVAASPAEDAQAWPEIMDVAAEIEIRPAIREPQPSVATEVVPPVVPVVEAPTPVVAVHARPETVKAAPPAVADPIPAPQPSPKPATPAAVAPRPAAPVPVSRVVAKPSAAPDPVPLPPKRPERVERVERPERNVSDAVTLLADAVKPEPMSRPSAAGADRRRRDVSSDDGWSSERPMFGVSASGAAPEPVEQPESKRLGLFIGVGVAALVIIAAGGYMLMRPKPATATPAAHQQTSAAAQAAQSPASPAAAAPSPAAGAASSASASEPSPVPNQPLSGIVEVVSSVPLDVSDGGRVVGKSGQPIRLPLGRHTLELSREDAGYRSTYVVDVRDGRHEKIRPTLPTGQANLNATPWAEVFVDGRSLGETPLGNVQLTIGPHEVKFRHPELGEQTRTLVVTASAPARLSVDLRK
jgi:hypothetical protein